MQRFLIFILIFLYTGQSKAQIKTHSGKPISIKALELKIRQAMDSLKIPGMSFAVINKSKVVYAKGFGWANLENHKKVSAQTNFEAASMSKPVFSFYVQQLAHKGIIDLNRPLYNYLPATDITDERYKQITARMVLSHTTGLPNWRDGDKMQLAFAPGSSFSYSGEAYMYLAKVVAHLRGRSLKNLDEDFQHEVAIPLNIKNFHFTLTQYTKNNFATGYQNNQAVLDDRDRQSFDAAGGMFANVNNYASFLIQIMKKRKTFPDFFTPVVVLKPDDPIRSFFGIDSWTAGLAVIKKDGAINYWHGGNNLGYTSSFMIDPEQEFGYVYFTNADQANGMKQIIEDILFN